MKYIGLMSGTSLDGLDIAYCSIDGFYTSTNVQLLAYKEVKMPKQLKEKIQFACNKEGAHTDDICSLNFELGTWFGESTKQLMQSVLMDRQFIIFLKVVMDLFAVRCSWERQQS